MSNVSLTLMFLFHLRQYTVSEVTSWIFGIPLATFGNIIWKIIYQFYSYYSKQITFPPLQERLSQSVKFFSYNVTWVGDGMEQECVMSVEKHKAKRMRSGKKQKYTITKFLGVSARGKCWYYSKSFCGSYNDMNVVSQHITITELQQILSDMEAIVLDSGYIGLERLWRTTNVLTPEKYVSQKWQQDWNALLIAIRLVAENYIAEVRKFKILQSRFRAKGDIDEILTKHHWVWICCAGINNEFIHPDGLRNADWRLEALKPNNKL